MAIACKTGGPLWDSISMVRTITIPGAITKIDILPSYTVDTYPYVEP